MTAPDRPALALVAGQHQIRIAAVLREVDTWPEVHAERRDRIKVLLTGPVPTREAS